MLEDWLDCVKLRVNGTRWNTKLASLDCVKFCQTQMVFNVKGTHHSWIQKPSLQLYLTPVSMRMISLTKSLAQNSQIVHVLFYFVCDSWSWLLPFTPVSVPICSGLLFWSCYLVVSCYLLVVFTFSLFRNSWCCVVLFWSWHLSLSLCTPLSLITPCCMLLLCRLLAEFPFPFSYQPQQLAFVALWSLSAGSVDRCTSYSCRGKALVFATLEPRF